MNPEDQLTQQAAGQMNDQPPQFIRAGTTVQLPYHINPETGTGYELEVEADTPLPVFQAEVDRLFPKTLASLATQLLDKSPDAPLLSQEDFMQVWNSAQAMDAGKTEKQNQIKGGPGFWKAGYDVIREAIQSLGTGAAEASQTLGQVGTAIADMNPNAAASAGVKLLNGLMTGTGRLSDSAKVLGALAWDKIAGDPYSVYKAGKDAQYAEYLRKTQGFEMVPGSTPQEIEAGLRLGNAMDITVLLPMVSGIAKGLSKGGQVVADQSIKQVAESMAQKSVETLGRRALGQVLETAGGAIEKAGALSGIGDSLAKGFLGKATATGALAAAYVLPEEGLLGDVGTALGAYGTLRTMQTGGAAMKWAGKILGSEELASKIVQQGLRNAEVQGAERLAVKLVKTIPDPAVRMTRKIMDGAMIPAAIGATLSGAQEASDPFSSPLDVAEATILGGLGGGAVGGFIGGAIGLGGEVAGKAREQSFVREVMTDIATRPEQRSFVVGNQDIVVPDDVQNRLSVLNSDRMTTREKASLFGVLDSAEHAGIDVAFINDSTQLPDALGGSGANMGKGVKFVNDAGKTTLFINADQINHTGAIHEVMHAYIGDQVASDFVRTLTQERGGELGAFQELSDFAQRYYDTQVQTNPEAAAQIKASIDRMNDPQVPLQDRLVAATDLAHEYMAEGISQSLADAKPESLQDFRGSAISAAADRVFQGTLQKINKSFGMSSVGATHDPISGHFFKDGQIISSQPLADITKKVQTAIKTRTEVPVSAGAAERPFAPKDAPVVGETMPYGGRVVAVEPRATYEDTHPNGALTTEAEKAKYHKAVWNQTTKFMGAEAAKDVLIEQGVYPGNIREGKGTPIIYTDKLTPQHISGLFQVQTHHGRPLIAPENRESVARFAQALNDGNLVTVTHSVNTSKSTGKDRAYAVSISQVGLPMAFSMSSGRRGSGPKMEFFNLSLVNDMVNLNRTSSKAIDAALKDLKVTSLDDTLPYAKAYIDNLSATGSVPSVRALAAVAPEGVKPKSLEFMRDILHLSSGIEPRESRGEVRINEPFTTSEQFLKYSNPELAAVTPTGEKFKTKLSRDRAVIQSVRLDGVTDVQLYQPNGVPVQMNVNKPQLVNKVRANFSPATSSREALPNGETITDGETGQRIIVSPKGKAKLFDSQGKLVGVFEDEDAAILKSNQDKLRANKTARSGGAVGGKAITVAYVSSTLAPGEKILNFGAGVPDKQTGKYLHSETLRNAGGNVKEYDFGRNEVGQLGEKFDTVFASNVLNVQADKAMLDSTLSQIWSSVGNDGRAVFNYPASPRYLDMSPSEVAAAIKDVTGITPQRVGGTGSTPLWEVSKKQQIRFSPKALDADYAKAVQANDINAAQKMVDEAAKAAGYNIVPIYHGTATNWNIPITPIFLADEITAKSYALERAYQFGPEAQKNGIVNKFYSNFKKIASEEKVKQTAKDLGIAVENDQAFSVLDPNIAGPDKSNKVINALKKEGYDSAKIEDFAPADFNVIESYVAFNPSQLKSAEPITRDSSGNVIPPSKRFDVRSADIRFSPKVLDADYSKAVQANDTSAAQQIVNEAAKAAGFNVGPVFHGTTKDFNVFKPNRAQGWGKGVYFASDKSVASEFGNKVVSAFLKIEKPFTGMFSSKDEAAIPNTKTYKEAQKQYSRTSFVDRETGELDWFDLYQNSENSDFANSLIRDLGYDGIIQSDSPNVQSGQEIVVFDPSQVKSAEPFTYDNSGNLIPVSQRFNAQTGDIRFSPRTNAAERFAATQAAEERKYGVPSTTPNLATFDAEAITKARNEIVRESTPTLVGKVADPELSERLLASQAVVEQARAEDALSRKVSRVDRLRKQLQQRQAQIQAAEAAKAKEGTLGPVSLSNRPYEQPFISKSLEDIPLPGSPTRIPAEQPQFTYEQFRRAISNDYFDQFPQPQEAPPQVTDLISKKMSRAEITHRTILGTIQADSAKAARVGDMKIDRMLAAMNEKREAMFDAELARIKNKFDTMELQGRAEEARQAGIDPEIVRRRQEHFANIRQQVAQVTEPAPLNSGPVEPPAQTLLPNMATAADDPRIPQDFVIQEVRGKFKIWSIGRQAVQAVSETYQEALKKAQAMQLKRRKKKNAA